MEQSGCGLGLRLPLISSAASSQVCRSAGETLTGAHACLPAVQRKDSDLGRAAAAQESQAAQVDELKALVDKGSQVRGGLVVQRA